MKKIIGSTILALLALVIVASIVIVSGAYNVAADEEHTALGAWLIEITRERSVASRADNLAVPNLDDAPRVRRGAGNYDAMCVSCHLAPGVGPTELSQGLYPAPPDLTKAVQTDPARAFWIIKHGLKATGMPAWGKSMEDPYIWDLVAFIRKLPRMTPQQYVDQVEASEGHSHGSRATEAFNSHGVHPEGERRIDPRTPEHSHSNDQSYAH